MRLCLNKIEKIIKFIIKAGNYLELLTRETMRLLESTKSKITNYENGENMPHLEITEVVLIHCKIVNSSYQQDLSIWSITRYFTENVIFFKIFNSKFSYIEVWFFNQNYKPLEVK